MWIRSQDKMQLVKINEIHIKVDEDGFVGIWVDDKKENLKYFLGTYKSKERAIEVLDDIQCFLENNYESDMPQHTNSLYPSYIVCKTYKTVYQMPKELLNEKNNFIS